MTDQEPTVVATNIVINAVEAALVSGLDPDDIRATVDTTIELWKDEHGS